jgi:hypothetical protein
MSNCVTCDRCFKAFKGAKGLAQHRLQGSYACDRTAANFASTDATNSLENYNAQDAKQLAMAELERCSDADRLSEVQMAELNALCTWDNSLDIRTCASIKEHVSHINQLRSEQLQSNIQKILDDAGVTDTSTLNEISQVIQDGLVSWQGTQRLKETEALRKKVKAFEANVVCKHASNILILFAGLSLR